MTPTTAIEDEVWDSDVLAYADRHRLRPYLGQLLQMTQEQFPAARSLEVFTQPDAEDPALEFLVFEVGLTNPQMDDYRDRDRAWTRNYFQIVPAPYSAVPVLSVRLEE